jgi:hypothetical protein
MPKQSFAQETDAWRQLASAVDRHAKEMPHLELQAAELADLVDRLSKLRGRQRRLRTQLLLVTGEMQNGLDDGRSLASRLRAGVKQVYGFHAGELNEFGTKPRRRTRRPRNQESDPDLPEGPPS